MFGPVDGNAGEDVVEGRDIKKNSDIVTLNYREVEYISQTFGT